MTLMIDGDSKLIRTLRRETNGSHLRHRVYDPPPHHHHNKMIVFDLSFDGDTTINNLHHSRCQFRNVGLPIKIFLCEGTVSMVQYG